jgi:hypothetical protein
MEQVHAVSATTKDAPILRLFHDGFRISVLKISERAGPPIFGKFGRVAASAA